MNALTTYYAESASASVIKDYRTGNVRTIDADTKTTTPTPAERLAVAADRHGLRVKDAARFEDIREEFGLTAEELTDEVVERAHRIHRQSVQRLKDRVEALNRSRNATAKVEGVEVPARIVSAPPRRKKTGQRVKVFGLSTVSVIRWMGSKGWTFEDATVSIETITGKRIADSTFRKQLKAGKDGRGTLPNLTRSQVRRLKDCAK